MSTHGQHGGGQGSAAAAAARGMIRVVVALLPSPVQSQRFPAAEANHAMNLN